jgi:hypothetical protein
MLLLLGVFLLLAPGLSVGSVSAQRALFARLFGMLFLLQDGGDGGSVLVLLLQKLLHRPISKLSTLTTPAGDVSIRQHTSAYVSIRQHTSAYVSIRQQAVDSDSI